MADINSGSEAATLGSASATGGKRRTASDVGGPDPKLVTFVELLFFAIATLLARQMPCLRSMASGAHTIAVLHFVNRSPA